MAVRDRLKLRDGFMNFSGGVNTHWNPNLLSGNQLAFAVNVSLRGGYAETRPGFREISMIFSNTEEQDWVESHNIQECKFYRPRNRSQYAIFSSGGRIFRVDPDSDFEVVEITPTKETEVASPFVSVAVGSNQSITVADDSGIFVNYPISIGTGKYLVTAKQANVLTATNINVIAGTAVSAGIPVRFLDPNASNISHAYMIQAEQYFIIQNGSSLPIIYDGVSTRRGTMEEIPCGTFMAYSKGRIWVAVSRSEYVAGDIVGGETGVLGMTENNLLSDGGAFNVPDSFGDITGMIVTANPDTSLGQGPLIIFTETAAFSVNAPADREVWKTMTDPIQTVVAMPVGAMNQRSIVNVNGDIFYRSRDGIRSLIMAVRDFSTWGQTAVSIEMNRLLADDDPDLLKYVSMILFDNRLICSNRPIPENTKHSAFSTGMIVLNFDSISSIGGKSAPVWEGLWTGINPYLFCTGIISGEERCFAWSRNPSSGITELWELTKNDAFDNDTGRIQCFFETAVLSFKSGFEMKKLYQGEIWVDTVVGTVEFNLRYRPDQYPCWFDWPNDVTICSKYKDCTQELADCLISRNFGPGYRTRLRWGIPPEVIEEFDNKPTANFYEMQLRLAWTGHARIKGGILSALQLQEEPHAGDLT